MDTEERYIDTYMSPNAWVYWRKSWRVSESNSIAMIYLFTSFFQGYGSQFMNTHPYGLCNWLQIHQEA